MFPFTWHKFPNYRQQESMDCGATCLKIICAYYGKHYEIEYLRNLCFQSKTGVSLLGLKYGATSLGFNAVGIKCSINELQDIPHPCILHWNQSHFVVLYKVSETQNGVRYYISDPIGYRFRYTDSEMRQCWLNQESQTGMVLCLEPDPTFKTPNPQKFHKTDNLKWLVKHLKGIRPHILNIVIGMLFCSLLLLMFPFLTQSIVDYGVAHKSINFVIIILIAQVVLIVSSNLIDFIRNLIFMIFFFGSAIYLLWITIFMRQRAILDSRMFAQNAATQSNVYELIYGMQEIKLNGCEDQKRWDWEKIQVKIYKLLEKGLALSQYQTSGALIINQTKNAIITAFVAAYTINGDMTLGMLIAIQFIIGQLNSPVEQFVIFMRKLQDAKLSVARLNSIYKIKDEIPEEQELIHNFKSDSIVFSNVSFKYDKLSDVYTIKDVTFTIPKGKCTAIVGLSGSGKTTLLKMILGFYEPDCGEVLIGGNKLSQYNLVEWRKMCGTVMQDGYIFSDTIASNIAPGKKSEIDMERVRNAAQIANIDSLIESLPERYQTIIGNDGKGLSMGQKQRILIARAIYKNPDYILLDEATNSLDANNEKEIMNSLNKFLNGKTSIIIAHRLSTVRNAHNIIVLDNGSVAEEGCHDDLICKKGLYYSLVKNQLDV